MWVPREWMTLNFSLSLPLSFFQLWEERHFMQVRLPSFWDSERLCKKKPSWVILSEIFVGISRIFVWSRIWPAVKICKSSSIFVYESKAALTGGQLLVKSILLGAQTFLSIPFNPPYPKRAKGLPLYYYSFREGFFLIFSNMIVRQSRYQRYK